MVAYSPNQNKKAISIKLIHHPPRERKASNIMNVLEVFKRACRCAPAILVSEEGGHVQPVAHPYSQLIITSIGDSTREHIDPRRDYVVGSTPVRKGRCQAPLVLWN